jgi:hypothetical protein
MSKSVILYDFINLGASPITVVPTSQDEINGYPIGNMFMEDSSIYWKSGISTPLQEIAIDLIDVKYFNGIAVLNTNLLPGDNEFRLYYGNSLPLTVFYDLPYPDNSNEITYKPNSFLPQSIGASKLSLSMERDNGESLNVGHICLPRKRLTLDHGFDDIKFTFKQIMTEEVNKITGFRHRDIRKTVTEIEITFNEDVNYNQLLLLADIQNYNYVLFFPHGDEPGAPFFYCTYSMRTFSGKIGPPNKTETSRYKGSILMEEQLV